MEAEDRCRPIDTLQEAYSYLLKGPPAWAYLTKPLRKRTNVIKNSDMYCDGTICHYPGESTSFPIRHEYGELPKTLLCHDMKNGYHDDSFVGGTINFDAYTFYHWASIDIFVYFSHHFITIPPLGWINTAHQHGVQILGTVITEWEKGLAVCNEFLSSEDEMKKFAHCLVAIAKILKLDGWLLNIENTVANPQMMIKFVEELTNKIHREIPNSLIIWYDSVTNKGSLDWQNGLTERNKDYFDVCDGIFTNYCWDSWHLQRSRDLAGSRKNDVFVGIDVWGRNFWGGGCFNTVVAVEEVHKYGLSMAIFAPAWTHEAMDFTKIFEQQSTIPVSDAESCAVKMDTFTEEKKQNEAHPFISPTTYYSMCATKEHFHLRENAFWNSIWEYLNTRGPINLPFKTSFCMGCGTKKRINGEIVSPKLWFDICEQQHQISVPFCSNDYYLEELETIPSKKSAVSSEVNTATSRPERDVSEERTEDPPTDHDGKSCLPCEDDETESRVRKEIRPKVKKPPKRVFKIHKDVLKTNCLSIYTDDSFSGGTCIKLSPTDLNNLARLFVCEFLCDYNFVVYYAIKLLPETSQQDVSLYLTMKKNKTDEIFGVSLDGDTKTVAAKSYNNLTSYSHRPVNTHDPEKFKNLQKNILEHQSDFYVPVENDRNWKIRYYCLDYPNSRILDVNSKLIENNGSILLGGFGVINDIVI